MTYADDFNSATFQFTVCAALSYSVALLHRVQKKVVYQVFVFEHNFTTTCSIFLQFSVTINE